MAKRAGDASGEDKTPANNPPARTSSAKQSARARKEADAERLRRRALFLRELAEAQELRERVHPRRTRAEKLRQMMRMRTFRI
jgi:hypothetical protein